MRKPLTVLLLGIVMPLFSVFSLTLDRYDIKVSDDNSTADQLNPRLTLGAPGSVIVIWYDKRGGQNNIYCQYLDSAGYLSGGNQLVNDIDIGIPQMEPSVSANRFGQVAGVWKDYRNGDYPFGADIYFSRIEPSQTISDINLTSELPDSTTESPDIALFSDGSSMVVWADYRNRNWDIYGQRLSSSGGLLGTNFRLNSEAGTFAQHSPRVCGMIDGSFVVVWYDNRLGNDDIFCRRYDRNGAPIGSEFKVSDDAGTARQAFPVVAADGYRRFYIAWVDWRNGQYPQNPDIYLRRYDSAGAALSASMKVNLNDGLTAQREVALASDNIGNLCLAWADSSTGQWNVRAQIIDNLGLFSGSAFKVHQDDLGRQLQPAVTMDNYNLYFAWADSRSGNFDIYLTLKRYNNPTLVAEPGSLNFAMERDGANPPGQSLIIRNAGAGALRWSARFDVDWVNLTPLYGVTPDTISVTIAGENLEFGEYGTYLRIENQDDSNATVVVPLNLTVTAPLLNIEPDSVYCRAFAALGNPAPIYLRILNQGSGVFNWSLAEEIPWLSSNQMNGMQNDSVALSIDISSLGFGRYREPVIFEAPEAVNSPETLFVILELVGNMPYLRASPDSFFFDREVDTNTLAGCQIQNIGTGALDWEASATVGWINILNSAGSDDDSLKFQIEPIFLSPGLHSGTITVRDSLAFNRQIEVPVRVKIPPADSIIVGNGRTTPGNSAVTSIELTFSRPIKEGFLPLQFNPDRLQLDSVSFQAADFSADVVMASETYDSGMFAISFLTSDSGGIEAGNYHLADLYWTAGSIPGVFGIDTILQDTLYLRLRGVDDSEIAVTVIAGAVTVDEPTAIDEFDNNLNPAALGLSPNFPNPFNGQTVFELTLNERADVTIEIFNILGQKIARIQSGPLSAGRHKIFWDGNLEGRMPAPSGIYFCRAAADKSVQYRKLLLLR
ncbi:MAG: FlgD immunoglobulin-like domain containing protein [Candidatus Zixiibacteriota bacterium]